MSGMQYSESNYFNEVRLDVEFKLKEYRGQYIQAKGHFDQNKTSANGQYLRTAEKKCVILLNEVIRLKLFYLLGFQSVGDFLLSNYCVFSESEYRELKSRYIVSSHVTRRIKAIAQDVRHDNN